MSAWLSVQAGVALRLCEGVPLLTAVSGLSGMEFLEVDPVGLVEVFWLAAAGAPEAVAA